MQPIDPKTIDGMPMTLPPQQPITLPKPITPEKLKKLIKSHRKPIKLPR